MMANVQRRDHVFLRFTMDSPESWNWLDCEANHVAIGGRDRTGFTQGWQCEGISIPSRGACRGRGHPGVAGIRAGGGARQAAFRKAEPAFEAAHPVARLLCQGLPCGRYRHSRRRSGLAGDPSFAQPPLGQPRDDRPDRAAGPRGQGGGRLERPDDRRHLPAAHRTRSASTRISGSPRCPRTR